MYSAGAIDITNDDDDDEQKRYSLNVLNTKQPRLLQIRPLWFTA